jgi:hypothetical protein
MNAERSHGNEGESHEPWLDMSSTVTVQSGLNYSFHPGGSVCVHANSWTRIYVFPAVVV